MKKEFQIVYKFSDVITTIEAETQRDAEKKANERLGGHTNNPEQETYCYELEAEEVE